MFAKEKMQTKAIDLTFCLAGVSGRAAKLHAGKSKQTEDERAGEENAVHIKGEEGRGLKGMGGGGDQ